MFGVICTYLLSIVSIVAAYTCEEHNTAFYHCILACFYAAHAGWKLSDLHIHQEFMIEDANVTEEGMCETFREEN